MVDKRLEIDIVANDRASRPIKNLQSTIIRFVGAVSASLAALRAVVFPIQSAREFERVLRDVQKTTGFVNEEISILGDQLLNLSRRVDTPANDLGRIAAAAGQLGLGEAGGRAILTFTESIARAATTLDLTAESAATNFAKIGTIFNVPIQNTENLISTINELSNTTTATADQLLDVVRRVGTVAGSFEDVAALAAQAIQLGLSPETAGTSLVKIFSNFESRADQFAEAFGITVGDFLGKGAVERWEFYLGELAKLSEEEAAKLINTLSGSGRIFALVDKQVQDAKNGFEIFRAAQENARESFIDGQSAIEEYANIAQSLDVQLKVLRNNFAALGTEIGLRLVPTLIESVKQLQEFLQTERAKVFFEALGQSLISIIDLFAKFVDIVTTLGAGALQNFIQVLLLGALVGAIKAVRGILLSLLGGLLNFRNSINASGDSVTKAAVAIGKGLGGAFGLIKKDSAEATVAIQATTTAVSNSIRVFDGAHASLGRYVDATQLAVVANTELAASTRAAQTGVVGAVGGGAAATAVDQGSAQARVVELEKELKLIARRKTEQEAIVRQGAAQVQNLKERNRIVLQTIKREGQISTENRNSLRFIQQDNVLRQERVAASGRQLTSLKAQTVEVQRQLVAWKGIRDTAATANFAELAGAGRGTRQLDRLGRTAVFIEGGFRNAGREAGRLGNAFNRVGRFAGAAVNSLRALGPIIRIVATGLRSLLALFGGPLGLALTALLLFGDKIFAFFKGLLGFVEESEAQLTEILRIEARNQQGIINQRIADFRRLQNELARSRDIDTQVDTIESDAALDDTARFAANAAKNLEDYTRAAAGAAAESQKLSARVEDLEEQSRKLGVRLTETQDQAEQEAITKAVAKLEEEARELNIQISKVNVEQKNLLEGARVAGAELAQTLTKPIASAIDLQSAYVDAEEQLGRLELQAKKLASVPIEADVVANLRGEDLENFRAQIVSIFPEIDIGGAVGADLVAAVTTSVDRLNAQIDDSRQNVQGLKDDATDAIQALSPSDRQIANAINLTKIGKETLDNLKDAEETAGGITRDESDRTKFLRDNAKQILGQFFAYELQVEELEKIEKALKDNKKAAQGIFDNTASETRAFTVQLEKVKRSLADIIRLRERERDLGRDITEGEEKIQSLNDEIVDLKEQVAVSTDTYFRNITNAKIQELEARKSIQETLVFDREREQATFRFIDLLEQIPGLTREAQQAAASGQVGPLQGVKDQIEQNVDDAEGILRDIAGLTDEEGNFLFRPGEIQDFEDALTNATGDYTQLIPSINKQLLDAASTAERQIAEELRNFTAQNAELVKNYEELIKQFPSIAKSLDVVRQAWERSNKPLIDAINNFGRNTQAAVLAGRGLSPGFSGQVDELSEASTLAAKRSIQDSFGDPTIFSQAVDAGLAGANLSAYKEKVRGEHKLGAEEGLNDIEPDATGGYVKTVKDLTTLAVEAALRDIAAGNLPDEIIPPSQRVRQGERQAQAGLEADPTASTQQRVIEESQKAIAETSAEGIAEGAAEGLLSPVAKAAAAELGEDVVDGIAFGFSTAGPIGAALGGLLGNIVDDFKQLAAQVRGDLKAGDPRAPGNPLIPGLAGGGHVRGPGGPTGDKIPAWLSDREYVSDARTVGFFGSGFFANLKKVARGSNVSTNRMVRGLPAFAGGGQVGKQSSGMANVHLHLPGGDQFTLLGDGGTVAEMQRVLSREALKRGRKR